MVERPISTKEVKGDHDHFGKPRRNLFYTLYTHPYIKYVQIQYIHINISWTLVRLSQSSGKAKDKHLAKEGIEKKFGDHQPATTVELHDLSRHDGAVFRGRSAHRQANVFEGIPIAHGTTARSLELLIFGLQNSLPLTSADLRFHRRNKDGRRIHGLYVARPRKLKISPVISIVYRISHTYTWNWIVWYTKDHPTNGKM